MRRARRCCSGPVAPSIAWEMRSVWSATRASRVPKTLSRVAMPESRKTGVSAIWMMCAVLSRDVLWRDVATEASSMRGDSRTGRGPRRNARAARPVRERPEGASASRPQIRPASPRAPDAARGSADTTAPSPMMSAAAAPSERVKAMRIMSSHSPSTVKARWRIARSTVPESIEIRAGRPGRRAETVPSGRILQKSCPGTRHGTQPCPASTGTISSSTGRMGPRSRCDRASFRPIHRGRRGSPASAAVDDARDRGGFPWNARGTA